FDKFLQHLDGLEPSSKTVQLRQWLHNIFEAGWQSVEDILVPKEPNLAFRCSSAVVRGKIIHLTADISGKASATIDSFQEKRNLWRGVIEPAPAVALLVAIEPTTDTETNIKVQVHPAGGADSLPLNLTLKVIDGEGTTVMEACAGKGNGCMTLEFAADRGECFSVVVKLKELCIAENFAA
ncbi:MAG: DUF1822 family protein, partial [Cyanobacteriota bacterium]|nr:DUF1822 family protein [Cyanobacteriota bacterium]